MAGFNTFDALFDVPIDAPPAGHRVDAAGLQSAILQHRGRPFDA